MKTNHICNILLPKTYEKIFFDLKDFLYGVYWGIKIYFEFSFIVFYNITSIIFSKTAFRIPNSNYRIGVSSAGFFWKLSWKNRFFFEKKSAYRKFSLKSLIISADMFSLFLSYCTEFLHVLTVQLKKKEVNSGGFLWKLSWKNLHLQTKLGLKSSISWKTHVYHLSPFAWSFYTFWRINSKNKIGVTSGGLFWKLSFWISIC
jgi:hypothetical protein